MSELITDAMVEAAANAFANHEYCINGPKMVPFCSCGWTATERYGVSEYDQHVARLTLEAAAPLIAAKVRGDADHIWLNAFKCIRPTDEFAAEVGRSVIARAIQAHPKRVALTVNAS